MQDFDAIYRPAVGTSEALRPLVALLFSELQATPINLRALKAATIALLEFLASPSGHTDANCRTVDAFLSRDESWDADRLPGSYVDILADMSGALHDTIAAPDIAKDFDSTPEQLLERARRL